MTTSEICMLFKPNNWCQLYIITKWFESTTFFRSILRVLWDTTFEYNFEIIISLLFLPSLVTRICVATLTEKWYDKVNIMFSFLFKFQIRKMPKGVGNCAFVIIIH